jgi:heterodisulfide reductase subunit A-like polyferredoxin
VILESEYDEGLGTRTAISRKYAQAVPGAYAIDKGDKAPCRLACPAGLNVQGYVQMAKEGKYKECLEIIMQELPLPGILGRICPAGCEDACRRAEMDQAIAIRSLKRLAADQFDPRQVEIPCAPKRQEKVAIIGSGPAGLSAAYHLARKGIQSTIFESQPQPGGMLRLGIPAHRLPREILDQEIEVVANLGVEIKTNTPLGPDLTVDQLLSDGYRAVYLAIGAHKGIELGIPGEKARGVRQGVDFLREVNLDGTAEVGRKVTIVGGGNVAIDVARSAVRLGADEVTVVYRRTCDEMPALKEEVNGAACEGVRFLYLAAPQEIVAHDGRITALRCIEMELGEPDSSGRRRPIPIPGSEFDLETDQLIAAIGQRPDLSALEDITGLEFTRWGTVDTDAISYDAGREGVFAGGDLQTGPWVAIGAVAAGREAAESIQRYLDGQDLKAGREPLPQKDVQNCRPIPEGEPLLNRADMPELPDEERSCTFNEVELGYDDQTGRAEAARCLNCGYCCECMQCVTACKAQAVDHSQKPEVHELKVGSMILSSGFQPFDPKVYDTYSYSTFKNVVTALEFERILAATGPWMGHLVRPGDEKEPEKIAFLQCVGSRDINACDHGYCSSVCCMYAIKECMIAMEHAGEGLETAVFYMDIRTPGKDFERYYEKAKSQGVRFVRSKVHSLMELPDGSLRLEYASPDGHRQLEDFDMVVLSHGMELSEDAREMAKRLDITLTPGGFVDSGSFAPVATSRSGVYACGALAGPKDIPQSVMEASAAACSASRALSSSRWTQTRQPHVPEERDVMGEPPQIGVFVCSCGINIAGTVDVNEVAEYARTLPGVTYVDNNLFTCSQDTQDKMVEVIREQNLNRVVVAACTPRTHEVLFQETIRDAGLNKYLFEMANIRNQCSWVHNQDPEAATAKAKDLVKMAVRRIMLNHALPQPSIDVTSRAMVIGGGIAGMTAALSIADQGYQTYLVEKSPTLGGNGLLLHQTWKGDDIPVRVQEMIDQVTNHPSIDVYTQATVSKASGFVGNFATTVSHSGQEVDLKHGVVVLATGAGEYKPDEYLYGQDDRVMTHLDLDAALKSGDERVTGARSAVFIQCVGSREPDRPYCSKVCCTHTLQSALSLKKARPERTVAILFRDMRSFGERESLYQEARKLGILFIRYDLEHKPVISAEQQGLTVTVQDHVLQQDLAIAADLVVLASAIVAPEDNDALSQLFKLSLNEDKFFMEAHPKLRPVEFATEGVFVAGLAHYPKPIEESIAQAQAAAAKASVVLSKDSLSIEGAVSHVNEELCRGCGECVAACPFSAIELVAAEGGDQVARVLSALCKGCGSCAVACPTGAAAVQHFEDDKILSMVESALTG